MCECCDGMGRSMDRPSTRPRTVQASTAVRVVEIGELAIAMKAAMGGVGDRCGCAMTAGSQRADVNPHDASGRRAAADY